MQSIDVPMVGKNKYLFPHMSLRDAERRWNEILRDIAKCEAVYLYGAGIVAYGVAEALNTVWNISIAAYIVSDRPGQEQYCGKKLLPLAALPSRMQGSLILIATPKIYHEEIARRLRHKACPYYALDHWLVYTLMGQYYRQAYHLLGLEDLHRLARGKPARKAKVKIFMAISTKDRPLKKSYLLPAHITKVQAGAAISENIPTADAYDDTGENISRRNANYSELTVAYWAWKNQRADYKGICHYRRVLELGEMEMQAIFSANIDAVLPYPYLCYGDTSFQYRRYIPAHDMGIFMHVLTQQERETVCRALRGKYLYNHNLVLAKENVFHDYCQWMFSILERAEGYHRERGIRRADRYAGYLGEILTSAYFTARNGELVIVHAPERWMG